MVQPAMIAQGLVDPVRQRAVARIIIDDFNAMLARVAERWPGHLVHLDFRNVLLPDADWVNEMHPRAAGFKKLADRLIKKVEEVV